LQSQIKTAVKKNLTAKTKVATEAPAEEGEELPPNSMTNVGTNAEIRQHMKLNTKE
jgi:hypothetical protein